LSGTGASFWRICGRVLAVVAALAGLALILFLALRASPSVAKMNVLPKAWGKAVDAHDFARNVAGFLGLRLWLEICLRPLAAAWSDRLLARTTLAVAVLVAGLELVQLFLPKRVADVQDVIAGWLGLALAVVVVWILKKAAGAFRSWRAGVKVKAAAAATAGATIDKPDTEVSL